MEVVPENQCKKAFFFFYSKQALYVLLNLTTDLNWAVLLHQSLNCAGQVALQDSSWEPVDYIVQEIWSQVVNKSNKYEIWIAICLCLWSDVQIDVNRLFEHGFRSFADWIKILPNCLDWNSSTNSSTVLKPQNTDRHTYLQTADTNVGIQFYNIQVDNYLHHDLVFILWFVRSLFSKFFFWSFTFLGPLYQFEL